MRRDKNNYYLDIAQSVLQRGTCLRRNFGALIVKNDSILATGYTGAPRGRVNCTDRGTCRRTELNIPKGQRYELCRSVHAEANAIIGASYQDMWGSTLYLAGIDEATGQLVENADACSMCKRLIINSGISRVVIRQTNDRYQSLAVSEWIETDDSLEERDGY